MGTVYQDDVIIDSREAAEKLQVSRRQIERLAKKGRLEAVRLPGVKGLFVTLTSVNFYGRAKATTREQMVVRLLVLEQKVNFLAEMLALDKGKYQQIYRLLRQNHPDLALPAT